MRHAARPARTAIVEPLEIRRLLSAGDLDPTFGNHGIIVDDASDPAVALVVQPDGKFVIASGSAISRYNADGSQDFTFGGNGNGFYDTGEHIAGLSLQPDGKIVWGGSDVGYTADPSTLNTPDTPWKVQRLNADGTLDTTFAPANPDTGFAIPPNANGSRSEADWFAVQPDGKFLLGGLFASNDNNPDNNDADFDLVRVNPDGTLDTTFGTGGGVSTTGGYYTGKGGPTGTGGPLLVRADGDILVGLSTPDQRRQTSSPGYILTFSPGGALLSSNSPDPLDDNTDYPFDASLSGTIRPDGTLVLGNGDGSLVFDNRPQAFHYNSALDQVDLRSAPGTKAIFGGPDTLLALPDNKLLVAGGGVGSPNGVPGDPNTLTLARVNPDGSPDLTFGVGGTTAITLDPLKDGWAGTQGLNALALTANGDILAAGNFRGGLLLARFQGGSHPVSQQPPQVTLTTHPGFYLDESTSRYNDFSLTVTFIGDHPIDPSTLADGDILVTGPNGYRQLGTLDTSTPKAPDLYPIQQTYGFLSPGKARSARGTYTVQFLGGRVRDLAGNVIPASTLGHFTLPMPDRLYGIYQQSNPNTGFDLLGPYSPRPTKQGMTFDVRIDAQAGVDLASLGRDNFIVTAPNGNFTHPQLLSTRVLRHGRTVIATYRVRAPGGGTWSKYAPFVPVGTYSIEPNLLPLDKTGTTIQTYPNAPEVYSVPYANYGNHFGNFTVSGQPTATLVGQRLLHGDLLRFVVRYNAPAGGMDLATLTSGVYYFPLTDRDGDESQKATLTNIFLAPDGTTLVTYEVAAGNPVPHAIYLFPHEDKFGTYGSNDVEGTPVNVGIIGVYTPPARA